MIQIGKVIYNILNNSSVSGYTQNIYPLALPENTSLPAIVYERQGDVQYNRDSYTYDGSYEITILSENYDECIAITQAVFNALQLYRGVNSGMTIIENRCTAMTETFVDTIFLQKLTFSVKIH